MNARESAGERQLVIMIYGTNVLSFSFLCFTVCYCLCCSVDVAVFAIQIAKKR